MTKGEVSKHAIEIAECEAAGEEVTTKRKERSDKEKKRGKRMAKDVDAEDGNNDGAGPSKCQKVSGKTQTTKAAKMPKKASAKSQVPPSNKFITTEDGLTGEE